MEGEINDYFVNRMKLTMQLIICSIPSDLLVVADVDHPLQCRYLREEGEKKDAVGVGYDGDIRLARHAHLGQSPSVFGRNLPVVVAD